jgi:ribonuclease HI
MIRNMDIEHKKILLDLFNRIWNERGFPVSWKKAIVIPIPKPGKDSTNPGNYRPIALTSCLCKTFERMVNFRLMWILEKLDVIAPIQNGFRRGRTTTDHLIRISSYVRDAFIQRKHAVSIFFDLEKAYDTTWKYGILKDLHTIGLRGNLPIFIKNYLSDRMFQVRLGNVLSTNFLQDQGVPQGGILSVTLFLVKINSIISCVPKNVLSTLYVDDFSVSYSGFEMNTIERTLQLTLNKVLEWANRNGFRFNESKTVAMHFCRKTKLHLDPELKIGDKILPVVNTFKFLGFNLDSRLSFRPHIKESKQRCIKALNVLSFLSSTRWGADTLCMLKIYRSLIRSKLDYACPLLLLAAPSYLKELDTVHNKGIRTSLGAYRTSPVKSLYVLSGEPSLKDRRTMLAVRYITKIYSEWRNPVYDVIFNPSCVRMYDKKQSKSPSFGILRRDLMKQFKVPLKSLSKLNRKSITPDPPWMGFHVSCDFSFTTMKKDITPDYKYQMKFQDHRQNYHDFVPIFTDGSKDAQGVGSAMVCCSEVSKNICKDASIFSAELYAIVLALQHINDSDHVKAFIYSDSLSSLSVLNSFKDDLHPSVVYIRRMIRRLQEDGFDVRFCWIPSHVGIQGNEKVDRAAAIRGINIDAEGLVPWTDLKVIITKLIHQKWQKDWENQQDNKLYKLKSTVQVWPPPSGFSRRDEVVLTRIRIGHSILTHQHLMLKNSAPMCQKDNCTLTINHIMSRCSFFAGQRRQCFGKNYFNDFGQLVGRNVHINLIKFLKDIGLYDYF